MRNLACVLLTTVTWTIHAAAAAAQGAAGAPPAADLLAPAAVAPVFAPGDTITISREEYEDLLERVGRIEGILGADFQIGLTLQNLKARLDAQEARDANSMNVTWKDGLRVENEDVQLKFGGRIQFDITQGENDSDLEATVGNFEDGAEFRRARAYASGSIFGQHEFKAQYDFAPGEVEFKDVWMQFNDIPVIDNVRVGQQYEPFGLEEQTSSNYITFMERALPEPFVPSRSSGVMTSQTFLDDRLYTAVGGFLASDDGQGSQADDGAFAVTARVAGLPVYQPDSERLLHLGAAFSNRSPTESKLKIEVRPPNHLAEKYLKSGDILMVDHVRQTGFEAAYVDGPFSIQGEVAKLNVERDGGMDDLEFDAAYLYASYFLTDDTRPYKKSEAIFDRVKPSDPFLTSNGAKGTGAWEVAYRWSMVDVNDGSVNGGVLDNHTLGLNWYLSRNTRIMLDHTTTELRDKGLEGEGDIWAIRFQTDF